MIYENKIYLILSNTVVFVKEVNSKYVNPFELFFYEWNYLYNDSLTCILVPSNLLLIKLNKLFHLLFRMTHYSNTIKNNCSALIIPEG